MGRVHPSAHDTKYDQPRVQEIGDNSAENEDAQAGVQSVQAIASSWSPASLIVAYVLIWIVYFVMLLQQGTGAALTPYVTSSSQSHSLTPTVNVLGSVIGGVCNLTVAKVLDVFGRPQGYALSLLLATVGLVMMAATRNVEMYAAAQVFWNVGNTALLYTVGIFIADTTALHNRGLMTALSASPNIVTIWLAGPIRRLRILLYRRRDRLYHRQRHLAIGLPRKARRLSYPVGTPARVAIQRAYADAQAMMLAAGTAIWALGFLAAAMWRDTDVRGLKQVRGRVI